MRMGDGWITVLDAIDDMLMVHSVDWDDRDDKGLARLMLDLLGFIVGFKLRMTTTHRDA